MVAEKYIEIPKRRGQTYGLSAGILARQGSPSHKGSRPWVCPLPEEWGGNLNPPEEGSSRAAPGSLPLYETEVVGKGSETLSCGRRGGSGCPCIQAGRERNQPQGDTPAGRWRMSGVWYGAGQQGLLWAEKLSAVRC